MKKKKKRKGISIKCPNCEVIQLLDADDYHTCDYCGLIITKGKAKIYKHEKL